MVDQFGIHAGYDHLPNEDGGYAVALAAVVLVESHDEQAVVGDCPLNVSVQLLLQPAVTLLDRAVVHVVVEVGCRERDCRKGAVIAWEVTVRKVGGRGYVSEVDPGSVFASISTRRAYE